MTDGDYSGDPGNVGHYTPTAQPSDEWPEGYPTRAEWDALCLSRDEAFDRANSAEACLEASGLPERVRVLEDALRSIEPNSIVMGRIRDWLDPLGGALTTPEDELKALWNWASMVSHIASAALGTEKEKG
jgi:hypothetical protein